MNGPGELVIRPVQIRCLICTRGLQSDFFRLSNVTFFGKTILGGVAFASMAVRHGRTAAIDLLHLLGLQLLCHIS